MSLLYAIAFGGLVAFSTYLPTMLVSEYGLAQTDAGLRTAGSASIGLLLLAATALLVGLFTLKAFRDVPKPS